MARREDLSRRERDTHTDAAHLGEIKADRTARRIRTELRLQREKDVGSSATVQWMAFSFPCDWKPIGSVSTPPMSAVTSSA